MIKAKKLRELFKEKSLLRVVGAHDGLSAKLVERNGFDGIWASGMEISTSYAVPDANILTMTQFLERAVEMNEASTIPVIADCDTGFGNSNNVIHMVKQYESAGIAAVCIEDKLFPKVNSFIPGRQELATVAEFVGKIMAAKNAQRSEDFMVIARVEALIAGWGMEEALRRAHAYASAGADAILIHSKAKTPDEIFEFAIEWKNRAPLVIVPTMYPDIDLNKLPALGIKTVIYANHGIRASVKAVNDALSQIRETGSTLAVEDKISPMKEIFDLQNMPRMKEDEDNYLRTKDKIVAVIPAAGDHLEEYSMKSISSDIPIAMLDINGKPLLMRQCEVLDKAGVSDVYVISGYKKELIDVAKVRHVENKRYLETGILHSVMCAREMMTEKTLVVYGDILFDEAVLNSILKNPQDIVILVCNTEPLAGCDSSRAVDFAITDKPPMRSRRSLNSQSLSRVLKIGADVRSDEAHFEFPGLMALSRRGVEMFKQVYDEALPKYAGRAFHGSASFEKAGLADILQELINRDIPVHCMAIDSGWLEIHSMEDYKVACSIVK